MVLWDIDQKGNAETASECRDAGGEKVSEKPVLSVVKVFVDTVDISSREAIYTAADRVKRELGDVDILVNNAGIIHTKYFMDTEDSNIRRLIDVNICAHFWVGDHQPTKQAFRR